MIQDCVYANKLKLLREKGWTEWFAQICRRWTIVWLEILLEDELWLGKFSEDDAALEAVVAKAERYSNDHN